MSWDLSSFKRMLRTLVPKKRCGICGGVLGENVGTICYRVADTEDLQEMKICKACGDQLEDGALRPEDFTE